MHLSMFSHRGGVAGIPWGLDSQTVTALGNLTDDFGTGVGQMFQIENLKEIMSKYEGMFR